MSEYILAGNRPGWDFAELTRIDCLPNAGGHLYTEFRDKNGELKALVQTVLLLPKVAA